MQKSMTPPNPHQRMPKGIYLREQRQKGAETDDGDNIISNLVFTTAKSTRIFRTVKIFRIFKLVRAAESVPSINSLRRLIGPPFRALNVLLYLEVDKDSSFLLIIILMYTQRIIIPYLVGFFKSNVSF